MFVIGSLTGGLRRRALVSGPILSTARWARHSGGVLYGTFNVALFDLSGNLVALGLALKVIVADEFSDPRLNFSYRLLSSPGFLVAGTQARNANAGE